MKKPAFLSNERLSRLMTALLLALGLLWPMLWALGVESTFLTATLTTAALTALMTFQAAGKKARVICFSLLGALLIGQFFLPGGGFFPSSVEAIKAISLYFNGVTTAPLLFSSQIALLLAVVAAVIGYAFSARGVGYIPATAMVVMVLFGLWSMGKQGFLWYAAPALVALLLLIAQSSHEKSNLFQVLPMAAMLVALGLLIAPGQNVVLGPLHEAAMNLKQTITDYLFFTEPRNVFTLGSYGYYPMGSGKLGGEAEPTEYPVMTVKTSQKTLLRAVTKDEYTGRSWRDTSSGRRYLYVNPRWRSLRQEVFLENMPAETVLKASNLLDQKAISIQMQNSAASTVFTPAYLRSLTTYGSMVPYFNEASELFITRDLISGDRYTVYAPVIEGGDASLGALVNAAPKNDPYYAQIAAKYTALPGHLEERVYQDMRSMIADAATPYEQACAILRHLQRYYRYTLSPVTPPENQELRHLLPVRGQGGLLHLFCLRHDGAVPDGGPARTVCGGLSGPARFQRFRLCDGPERPRVDGGLFRGLRLGALRSYPCPAERGSAAPAERPGAGTHADPQPGTAAGRAGSAHAQPGKPGAEQRTGRYRYPGRRARPERPALSVAVAAAPVAGGRGRGLRQDFPADAGSDGQKAAERIGSDLPVWQRRLYPDEADGPHAPEGRNASALCPPHG